MIFPRLPSTVYRLLLCLLPSALCPLFTAAAAHPQAEFARADYQQQLGQGYDCRYVALDPSVPQQAVAVRLLVSMATRQALLDDALPVRVPGTRLLRINLTALLWDNADYCRIFGAPHSPYTAHQNPLIVPAGFVIDQLSDQRSSDAYLRFVFGGKNIPKTAGEFERALGIDAGSQNGLAFGLVEGQSRVNVAANAARLLENLSGTHVEAWRTFDVIEPRRGADPLEALFAGEFKADGSEGFILYPAVLAKAGVRGIKPITYLANGAGKLVAEAPVELVRDHTDFRGPAIINPGSCIVCHDRGPNLPTQNALRQRLEAGVELNAQGQRKTQIEVFHLGSAAEPLRRWEAGYVAYLRMVVGGRLEAGGWRPEEEAGGWRPEEAHDLAPSGLQPPALTHPGPRIAEQFQQAVRAYDADLTIADAARELSTDVVTLRNAVAYAAAEGIVPGNRISALCQAAPGEETPIPRTAFESEFLRLKQMIETFLKVR